MITNKQDLSLHMKLRGPAFVFKTRVFILIYDCFISFIKIVKINKIQIKEF